MYKKNCKNNWSLGPRSESGTSWVRSRSATNLTMTYGINIKQEIWFVLTTGNNHDSLEETECFFVAKQKVRRSYLKFIMPDLAFIISVVFHTTISCERTFILVAQTFQRKESVLAIFMNWALSQKLYSSQLTA
jgi:hypothetical protein